MPHHPDNALVFVPLASDPDSAWGRLMKECEHFHPSTSAIKLLRSGLDGIVKTVALERDYVCKDHRDLHSHFLSKKFWDRGSHCSRLHFFSDDRVDEYSLFDVPDRAQDAYLGYSVIRPMPMNEIGRTVVAVDKLGLTHHQGFFQMKTRFRACLNGVDLFVEGFPFMTQDSEATVCSHTALWGVCRYLSQRYSEYGEFRPYDLISRASRERGRVIPYRGMTHSDYSRILSDFGCHPVSFTTSVGEESFLDACVYVESGIPVIASIKRQDAREGHVIVLIGHTMGEGTHSSASGFRREITVGNSRLAVIESSAFLNSFVIIDDNLFPSRQLGFRQLGGGDPLLRGRGNFIDGIHTVVVPLPEKVYMSASVARKLAYALLAEIAGSQSASAYFEGTESDPLVTRLFFTTSRAFKSRKLKNLRTVENDPLLGYPLDKNLPHFIWVMEVTRKSQIFPVQPEPNCFAEIVMDATSNEFEDSFIYARVANQIADGAPTSEPNWREAENCPCSFPQFLHNLGNRDSSMTREKSQHLPNGRNA